MTAATTPSPRAASFPKSARLRKSRDFKFRPYRRFQSQIFNFVYTSEGFGRLGISISRKVLRRATARNRVRRLVREAFRKRLPELAAFDIHVVGQPRLGEQWATLKLGDVEGHFDSFLRQVRH